MIKTILVADDERANLVLLRRTLEKGGYDVLTAENGREALAMIESHPVDLLITDVVMPEMDGVDLYMSLKENPATATLPVIIVTDKELFQESFASLGLEIYCPKPFNMPELLDKIKTIEAKFANVMQLHKVVVIGPDDDVLQKMCEDLKERNCVVAAVSNVIEIGLRCFMFNPRLILLDVHSREYATTKEIIRSLRSFEYFKNTTIVIFSNFRSGDAGVISSLETLEQEIHACLQAGANKYIGRFNRVTFIEQLKEFGI